MRKRLQHSGDQNLRVSGKTVNVLSMRNEPLVPTTPRKARILVRYGKDKIISYKPFAIQATNHVDSLRKQLGCQITKRSERKLVNDREEISNVGMPPQFQPLRVQIKQSLVEEIVFESLNLPISDREEDGFYDVSNIVDTHNSNKQEAVKALCLYM